MGLRSSVVAGLSSVPALGNATRRVKATDPHGGVRIGETGHGHRRAWAALACAARRALRSSVELEVGRTAKTEGAMATPEQRVTIWNSFFRLAWSEAKRVFELSKGCTSNDEFVPSGGTLGDEASHVLAALVFCVFSIEARANHLIEELQEKGTIG